MAVFKLIKNLLSRIIWLAAAFIIGTVLAVQDKCDNQE